MNLNRCFLSHMAGAGSGGGRFLEGCDYLKYCHERGAIIRARRLIEGRLLFEEIRHVNNIVTFVVATVAKILDLNKPCSCKYGEKNEKIDMYDFLVRDCTQEQNGSSYFSSIV